MRGFRILVIRFVLAVVFAFLATRIFFGDVGHLRVFGLAVILWGLAYLFEYLRKRDRGGDHGR